MTVRVRRSAIDRGLGLELQRQVCFRLTRVCNARCGFCLAPTDGRGHPSAKTLLARVDWLVARGVETLHLCGGEPTIHPALPAVIRHVHELGRSTKLTTNAIELADPLLEELRASRTEVKVSLHGDRERHNAIVGRDAFDRTTANVERLLAARVATSIQTTVVAKGLDVVEWVARWCWRAGIERLSILPFIPRGAGFERRGEFALSPAERRALRELVRRTRRELSGSLDVRWLDFSARPLQVVEPDGRVVLESANERMDRELARIPATA